MVVLMSRTEDRTILVSSFDAKFFLRDSDLNDISPYMINEGYDILPNRYPSYFKFSNLADYVQSKVYASIIQDNIAFRETLAKNIGKEFFSKIQRSIDRPNIPEFLLPALREHLYFTLGSDGKIIIAQKAFIFSGELSEGSIKIEKGEVRIDIKSFIVLSTFVSMVMGYGSLRSTIDYVVKDVSYLSHFVLRSKPFILEYFDNLPIDPENVRQTVVRAIKEDKDIENLSSEIGFTNRFL